jgi:glycosyltransferase involved in cell wall biosynthesis
MQQKTEQEIMQKWKSARITPLVSICSIAYNHEKYIGEALDNFLMQETDFPFEILIHDDYSIDKTADIIRVYEKKYPNIIKPIYQTENQYSKGILMNPTFNFPRAKGDYIAMCEGDDYWNDPLKLQKQVDFLEANNEYACCFHDSVMIDQNGLVLHQSLLGNAKDYSEMELLSTNVFITTHSVMFRNVVVYPEELKEAPFGDMVLWHLLGFHGKAKYMSSIEKAAYRRHDGGVWSGSHNYTKFLKTIFAKKLIRQNLVKNNIATVKIDLSIENYISLHLSSALIQKNFNLYKAIFLKARKIGYSDLSMFGLIIKSTIQAVHRTLKSVIDKIS